MPLRLMIAFVAVATSMTLAFHLYLTVRIPVMLASSDLQWAVALAGHIQTHRFGLAGGLSALMISYFLIGKEVSPRRVRWLAWASSGWMGAVLLLLLWVVAHHFAEALVVLFRAQLPALSGVACLAGAASMWTWGLFTALRPPALREVELPVAGLANAHEGLKILQITDVHIGPTLGQEFLQRIVDRSQALEPDLIVITGDLVDGSVRLLRDEIAPIFQLSAPLGVFFITGNHELISGADPWVAHLRKGGITVLENQAVLLEHKGAAFNLVGVDDWDSQRFQASRSPNLGQALQNVDTSKTTVLLAHQPKAIVEACERGVDVQLSGHTHGGQIAPFAYMLYFDQPHRRGLYQVANTQLYVSEGAGYWGPPIRVGTRSEITLLRLVGA